MKRILIEIDAGEETCYECRAADYDAYWCWAHDKGLSLEGGKDGTALRLPICLAAEEVARALEGQSYTSIEAGVSDT